MKKLPSITLTALLATGVFVPVTLQMPAITAQAANDVNATGIVLPRVASGISDDRVSKVLSKKGLGTQLLEYSTDSSANIRDIVTGEVLREVFDNANSVTVNDAENLFVATDWGDIYYATSFDSQKRLEDPELELDNVYGFFNNTNIFVGKYNNKLIAYDFDSKTKIFSVALPNYENNRMFAVGEDVAVAVDNNVTIYNQQGQYVDVFQLGSNVTSLTYSPDGNTLVVGTEEGNLQFFDATNNYTKINRNYSKSTNAELLTFDPSGKYISFIQDYNFRLYNTQTGERIYTSLDNEYAYDAILALATDAKFVYYSGSTFNGKNISNYIKSIKMPSKFKTLESNDEVKPAALITRANGAQEVVTDGVTWQSDDLSMAYFDKEKGVFKTRKAGTFTVRISYLGFSQDVVVKVIDTPRKYMKDNYYINSIGLKNVNIDQRVYKGGAYRYATTVAALTGKKNGAIKTYLDVARKATTPIKYTKIIIKSNRKTWTKKVSSSKYGGYERANYIPLSSNDIKWFKANINSKKSATVQFVGKKKKITKTLSATQRSALLDGVLMNDYLKKKD